MMIIDKNDFHAPTPVGKTRTMTPEGFLLCEDVRIGRIGEQRYAARELTDQKTGQPAVEPGPDGVVVIGREPDEVFRDESIKSFEGKPVTVEHPNEFVNPQNWKHVAVGTTHNVHQGEGGDKDFLMADLLITDKNAIDHVNRDMPQISCGYDSEYEQTGVGRGIQRNIVGNHVALVDRGRAGPRCAIRDSVFKPIQTEVITMAKASIVDRLMSVLGAVKNKDQAALDRVLSADEDMPMGETFGSMDEMKKSMMDGMKTMMDGMKKSMMDEMMDGMKKSMMDEMMPWKEEMETRKKAVKEDMSARMAEDTVISPEMLAKNPDMMGRVWTGDSVSTFTRDVLSRAELLAPGISTPSGDVSQAEVKSFMVRALAAAATTDAGKECIKPFLSAGQTLDSLKGREVAAVFNGAAEVRRLKNNSGFRPTSVKTADFSKPVEVADIQKLNEEFWANGGKRKAGK